MKQESQRVAGEVEAATYDDGLASIRGGCRGMWIGCSCRAECVRPGVIMQWCIHDRHSQDRANRVIDEFSINSFQIDP